MKRGEYEWKGERQRLCWLGDDWDDLIPVGEAPARARRGEGARWSSIAPRATSRTCRGRSEFHPNKPPGTSLLALPGYFVVYHVERLLGINPDHWWTIDVNCWLASVFSVGLISALGCVLFFRVAADLAGGNLTAALGATVAFAFGTTFFPFGTLLFDHDLTASFLIAAFYFLRMRPVPAARNSGRDCAAAWRC